MVGKAIVTRIKISAYNAEEWLLDRLVQHYHNPDGVRDLLGSIAQLSREIRVTAGAVEVTLDPPDTLIHRRALAGLVDDLNGLGATFQDTDVPVRYRVAVLRSEVAALPQMSSHLKLDADVCVHRRVRWRFERLTNRRDRVGPRILLT